ncbi:MAG: aminopeptidase [Oscillospiraceae bacterium]
MSKETKKSEGKKLSDSLLYTQKHSADHAPASVAKANKFSEGYKKFLDAAKTEREAVRHSVALLEKNGYTPYKEGAVYNAGDKIYLVNRAKAVIAATIGKKPVEEGVLLSIAHIDSPRLDLKPNPLYEADELSYFKTHYYGGIRKYQWVAIPLAMHGVVVKADGEIVEITIGEEENDPVFTITDLLPHLSAEQNKRPLSEGIRGEELNILVGSLPYMEDKEEKQRVKLETMRLLNKKYGFTERDFTRAEIEFVPAFMAKDVGIDASLIGAYGQDDRVCAYTALMAEIEVASPKKTTVCVLTDKEETGSDGNTGLAGRYLFHFLESLAEMQKGNYRALLAASVCLSADVNAAFDPTFPEPFERRNSSFVNNGVVITKYTGARGKGGTSDASAELMGLVTNMLDAEKIAWQVGELGKVDAGGGGTIAKFVANHNVEVVDVGVPVLSMHAPFEITGKLDVYNTYLAFKAFAKMGK